MKILNLDEFLACSEGTLFCHYSPCIMGELLIKGESIPSTKDFFYQSIAYGIEYEPYSCLAEALDEAEKGKYKLRANLDVQQRDGMFDKDQFFLVWERGDVEALMLRLQQALRDSV